jgi:hypothetical protein
MNSWLSYIFWPNPGNAGYDNPKVIALLVISLLLIAGSFVLGRWRNGLTNQSLKKVSRSWGSVTFWLGLTGFLFTIARVEQIQFLAMRFLWLVWFVIAVLFIILQIRAVRTRTYEVIPTVKKSDARSKYLPTRKRR